MAAPRTLLLCCTALLACALQACAPLAGAHELDGVDCRPGKVTHYPRTGTERAERAVREAKDDAAQADAQIDYAKYQYAAGDSAAGDATTARALALWNAATPDARRALTLQEQAQTLFLQSSCKLAAALFDQVLATSEKILGPDHAQTVGALHNVVRADLALKRSARLDADSARLLAAWERRGAPPADEAAVVYTALAESSFRRQRYAQAEPLALNSLALTEKAYGPNDGQVAARLYDLAAIYYGALKFTEGQAAQARATQLLGKLTAARPPEELGIKTAPPPARPAAPNEFERQKQLESDMAALYRKGDSAAALRMGEAVLRDLEQQLKADDAALAAATTARASLSPDTPKFTLNAADAVVRQARGMRQRDSNFTSAMLARLAELQHAQKHYDQAEALYLKAMAGHDGHGADPLALAPLQSDLAMLYRARAEYARALPLQLAAFDAMLPALGASHPDVIDSARELGLIYQALGQAPAAQAIRQRLAQDGLPPS